MKLSNDGRPYFHLHPPKTGGSSLVSLLLKQPEFSEAYGYRYAKDNSSRMYPTPDASSGLVTNSFHFTTYNQPGLPVTLGVRNPYTRFISMFHWYKARNILSQDKTMHQLVLYIKNLHAQGQMSHPGVHRRNLTLYGNCYTWQDHCVTSDLKLIRFEQLEDDVKDVYGITGLPHVHKTNLQPKTPEDILNYLHTQNELDDFNELTLPDFVNYGYKTIDKI